MLRFVEGFDHYPSGDGIQSLTTSQLGGKWDFGPSGGSWFKIDAALGRFGTKGVALTACQLARNMTTKVTTFGIMGSAIYIPSLGSNHPVHIFDARGSTADTIQVFINNDGSLSLKIAGVTIVTTAPGMVTAATYIYLETKLKVNVAGQVQVRLSGVEVIDTGTIDTRIGGVSHFTGFGMSTGSGLLSPDSVWYDDIYFCDDTGTVNNDWLGDVRVQTLIPNGVGNSSDFTRVGGEVAGNYTAVDEIGADDETSYNESNTLNAIDLYTLSDLLPANVVKGLSVTIRARKDNATYRTVSGMIRSGATNGTGAGYALPTSFSPRQTIFEVNPVTGVAFTIAEIDALQAGLKVAT